MGVRRDHADRFRFAPLQSALTAVILSRHGIDREAMLKSNTVYLVLDFGSDHERLLTQSDVTVNMLLLLGGRLRVLGYLLRAGPVSPQCGLWTVRAQPLLADRPI